MLNFRQVAATRVVHGLGEVLQVVFGVESSALVILEDHRENLNKITRLVCHQI
jgi:hypothetical protein